MKRRITVFTRETYERVTFEGRPATPGRARCGACGAETGMITAEAAARLASVSARSVYRLAEAGLVHFAETPDGGLLVCVTSLSERLAAPPPSRLTTSEP